MDLLNLTGPTFLNIYLALLLGAVALAIVLRRRTRIPLVGSDPTIPKLDPFEIAYLTGKEWGAADAAIASLVQRGAVKVNPVAKTIIIAGESLPRRLHSLERAIAPEPSKLEVQRTIAAARQAAKPAFDGIRNRLIMLGLLVEDGQAWIVRLLPTLPLLAVLLLGLAKVQVGLVRGKPISFLVALCLITTLIGVGFMVVRPFRSRWGEEVLQHLRRENAALQLTGSRRCAELASDDLALAVGLFGTTILAGGPLNDLRAALAVSSSVGGTSGGGGDSGSCGGGCGGSGCGGCGS